MRSCEASLRSGGSSSHGGDRMMRIICSRGAWRNRFRPRTRIAEGHVVRGAREERPSVPPVRRRSSVPKGPRRDPIRRAPDPMPSDVPGFTGLADRPRSDMVGSGRSVVTAPGTIQAQRTLGTSTVLTVAEVAERLRLSRATVYRTRCRRASGGNEGLIRRDPRRRTGRGPHRVIRCCEDESRRSKSLACLCPAVSGFPAHVTRPLTYVGLIR